VREWVRLEWTPRMDASNHLIFVLLTQKACPLASPCRSPFTGEGWR
jgi:hypothetical protein